MEEKKINMIEPVEQEDGNASIKNEILYRKCKSCGCLFPLTWSKLEFFANKFKTIPTHCYNCRQKRPVQTVQK